MTTKPTVGGIEVSHGKPRQARVKLRSVSSPPTTGRKPRPAEARPNRTANRSLLAPTRAAAGEAIRVSLGGGSETPPSASQLAQDALKLYRAFLRELGGNPSPTVRSHALSYALQHAVSVRLLLAADAAGLETDRGLELAERAQRAQGSSSRSATAAVAFAGLLGRPKALNADDMHQRVTEAFGFKPAAGTETDDGEGEVQ